MPRGKNGKGATPCIFKDPTSELGSPCGAFEKSAGDEGQRGSSCYPLAAYGKEYLCGSSIGDVYSSMKRSLAVIAVLTIAFAVGSIVYFVSSTRQPGHVDALKILTAASNYTTSLRVEGLPVPDSVSLQELINLHLLTASDVSGFKGMDVTVNLSADNTRPQN